MVVRPPPETSEYHAPNDLYRQVVERLAGAPGVEAIIPRTGAQVDEVHEIAPNVTVPLGAVYSARA